MLTKINGRTHYFSTIRDIRKIQPGHWHVERNGRFYHIEGGKAAGGSRRDWFVDGFGGKGIPCTSLVDALKLIDSA